MPFEERVCLATDLTEPQPAAFAEALWGPAIAEHIQLVKSSFLKARNDSAANECGKIEWVQLLLWLAAKEALSVRTFHPRAAGSTEAHS
jgi:hypothetical protein